MYVRVLSPEGCDLAGLGWGKGGMWGIIRQMY